MATYLIEISPKKAAFDPLARQVMNHFLDEGLPKETLQLSTSRLFELEGDLGLEEAKRIAENLLVDTVVEKSIVYVPANQASGTKPVKGCVVDIWPQPGVTDPVSETVEKGIKDLGVHSPVHVHFAQRYLFPRLKDRGLAVALAKSHLANELIHDIRITSKN